jgi:class 3 adenylate cyclase
MSSGDHATATKTPVGGVPGLTAAADELVGTVEALLADARDLGQEQFLIDLRTVRQVAGRLRNRLGLIPAAKGAERPDAERRALRHDLRTPPSQIKSFCELFLEQAAEELFLDRFLPEIARLRDLASSVIEQIDEAFRPTGSGVISVPWPRGATPPGGTPAVPADGCGRLLVVDDDPCNRELIGKRLERLGHRVETADGGPQALAMLAARPFDLVLLDMLMPGMGGVEVLRRLKADPALRDVPVIIVSALDEIGGIVNCIGLGAEDYLPRCFEAELLRARVDACLEKKRLRDRERGHLRRIDELLHAIFPAAVVTELKETNAIRPRRYERVGVLFSDVVGFTPYCDGQPPEAVVARLQELVHEFEVIAARRGVQKIKTVGDAFMAAAGLLGADPNPVRSLVGCGLEMVAAVDRLSERWRGQGEGHAWQVRVGVHVGPVVAGVLGRSQYSYDLWGDTVNTAARMESHGLPGGITLSAEAWHHLDAIAEGRPESVAVKGKGTVVVWRFERFRPGA